MSRGRVIGVRRDHNPILVKRTGENLFVGRMLKTDVAHVQRVVPGGCQTSLARFH